MTTPPPLVRYGLQALLVAGLETLAVLTFDWPSPLNLLWMVVAPFACGPLFNGGGRPGWLSAIGFTVLALATGMLVGGTIGY